VFFMLFSFHRAMTAPYHFQEITSGKSSCVRISVIWVESFVFVLTIEASNCLLRE
jgi:hypothetical protein